MVAVDDDLEAIVLAQDVARAPFTGPRVEGLVGYDNLRDGSDGNSDGRDGVVYGAAVGYDVQVGGAVLGVEGEITDSSTNVRTSDLLVASRSVSPLSNASAISSAAGCISGQ